MGLAQWAVVYKGGLDMLRFSSMAVLGLALAMPLGASATDLNIDPNAASVVAANEDVFPRPPKAERQDSEQKPAPRKNVPRGSSQSDAGFRFQNPYAFPVQTLPIALPTVTTFSF